MVRFIIGLGLLLAGAAHSQSVTPAPSVPTPTCSIVLPPDAPAGNVGTGMACAPRVDATRVSVVQKTVVTANASGVWSVTWNTPFATSPVVSATPINASSQPIVCNVNTITSTTATGTCWQAATATLLNLGSVLNVFPNGASNVQVQLVAGPPSQ